MSAERLRDHPDSLLAQVRAALNELGLRFGRAIGTGATPGIILGVAFLACLPVARHRDGRRFSFAV